MQYMTQCQAIGYFDGLQQLILTTRQKTNWQTLTSSGSIVTQALKKGLQSSKNVAMLKAETSLLPHVDHAALFLMIDRR